MNALAWGDRGCLIRLLMLSFALCAHELTIGPNLQTINPLAAVRTGPSRLELDTQHASAEAGPSVVVGVLADLSGRPLEALPPVEERRFVSIDTDSFDEIMNAKRPRLAFMVPNVLTGDGKLVVDLTFTRLEDFEPAAVARQIDPLARLLDAREQLAGLLSYIDGKPDTEKLLASLLEDPVLLKSLAVRAAPPNGQP